MTITKILAGRSMVGVAIIAALVLAVLAFASPARAATHTVTNTHDSGSGSLRQAISDAGSGDTILFSLPSNSTIALDKRLSIQKPLEIQGPGVSQLTIKASQGATSEQAISVGKHTVGIEDLTIFGGRDEKGGGIYNQGNLYLIDVVVTGGNDANSGGGIYNDGGTIEMRDSTVSGNNAVFGGGIYNQHGTLDVKNSTVNGNTATHVGGEMGDGGGIFNTGGTLILENSTISGNTAQGAGGGIYNSGDSNATLNYVTLFNNVSSFGANFVSAEEYVDFTTRKPRATLKAVLAVSSVSAGPNCDAEKSTGEQAEPSAFMTSQGYNMAYENAGDSNTCNFNQSTDWPNTDPLLRALTDNGGPTATHALPADSPAVDAIPVESCPTLRIDQRGIMARPQDGDGDGAALCDVGAFELGTVADLSIDLEAPQSAQVGVPFDYTITVTNNGPTEAVDTLVEDDLPDGVTYDSSTEPCDVPTPDEEPGMVLCELGHMNPGESQTLTITVIPTRAENLANRARVAADTHDPNGDNNTSAVRNTAVTIGATADLSVDTETLAPRGAHAVDVGGRVEYYMTVRNAGPDPAAGVKTTYELPAGTTFVEASRGCAYSAGTVTCSYEDGDKTVYPHLGGPTFQVVIKPELAAAGTTLSNTARVSGHVYDPNKDNDSSTSTIDVNPAADLSIRKTGPETASVGEELTYTLTAANGGPNQAGGVWVHDTLPANAAFVSATPSASGGCDNVPVKGASGQISCYFATVDDGASATVEVVTEPMLAAAGTTLTNTANATTQTFDPDTSNNQTTADTVVASAADLSMEVDAPDSVDFGQQLTYTLTATNAGPNAATGVEVSHNLPENVAFSSATPTSGGECQTPQAGATGTVECSFGTLGKDGEAAVEVAVNPTPAAESTTLENAAGATADTFDPSEANNTASAATRILDVTKPTVEDTAPAGGTKRASPKSAVTVTFSEAMDASTLTKETFTLTKKGSRVRIAATVDYGEVSKKAILRPNRALTRGATYTARVTTAAKDLAGNPLAKSKVWKFTVKR